MAKKKRRKPNLSNEALERARRELRGEPVEAPLAESQQPAQQAAPSSAAQQTAPQEQSVAPPAPKPKAEPVRRQPEPVLTSKRTMSRQELATEYGYVINDLTSMGVLAVILFIAMVVVSLVIEQIV